MPLAFVRQLLSVSRDNFKELLELMPSLKSLFKSDSKAMRSINKLHSQQSRRLSDTLLDDDSPEMLIDELAGLGAPGLRDDAAAADEDYEILGDGSFGGMGLGLKAAVAAAGLQRISLKPRSTISGLAA